VSNSCACQIAGVADDEAIGKTSRPQRAPARLGLNRTAIGQFSMTQSLDSGIPGGQIVAHPPAMRTFIRAARSEASRKRLRPPSIQPGKGLARGAKRLPEHILLQLMSAARRAFAMARQESTAAAIRLGDEHVSAPQYLHNINAQLT